MSRWFFYILGSALLLGFVLALKYLASLEGGTFGDGYAYGLFTGVALGALGLWLQERSLKRQSRDDR